MFQPVIPLSGYVGWRFLERTLETQQETFSNSAQVTRAADHFRDKIETVWTADDLIEDRRLLEVALGAFGLSEDIDNTFFIKKVLSDGTTSDDALSNKLADKRYRAFSEAFGFGEGTTPKTLFSGFADTILSQYERKSFEAAVGEQDNDLRLAMNVSQSLTEISDQAQATDSQWFALMGDPPMRQVMEKALGLPTSFAQIDIDQQLSTFKDRALSTFGSDRVADLMEPTQQEKLIRLFLIRSEAESLSSVTRASAALALLRG